MYNRINRIYEIYVTGEPQRLREEDVSFSVKEKIRKKEYTFWQSCKVTAVAPQAQWTLLTSLNPLFYPFLMTFILYLLSCRCLRQTRADGKQVIRHGQRKEHPAVAAGHLSRRWRCGSDSQVHSSTRGGRESAISTLLNHGILVFLDRLWFIRVLSAGPQLITVMRGWCNAVYVFPPRPHPRAL